MTCVADVVASLDRRVPPELQEPWDHVGLHVGHPSQPVTQVLTTLDVLPPVIATAVLLGAGLIVAHHPLIFQSFATLSQESLVGQMLETLVAHRIAVYVAHTNCDSAVGGLNEVCAKKLGLRELRPMIPARLPQQGAAGLGRVGDLACKMPLGDFLQAIQQEFGVKGVRYTGDLKTPIKTVAVCTGSGGSLWTQAQQTGASVFVTGDVKYHQALDAEQAGFCLVDLGHFATEGMVMGLFAQWIRADFPQFTVECYHQAQDPLRVLP